jgi:hypothetical protein
MGRPTVRRGIRSNTRHTSAADAGQPLACRSPDQPGGGESVISAGTNGQPERVNVHEFADRVKARGPFPSDQVAIKRRYLGMRPLDPTCGVRTRFVTR